MHRVRILAVLALWLCPGSSKVRELNKTLSWAAHVDCNDRVDISSGMEFRQFATTEWIRPLYAHALRTILKCHARMGRYWEVDLKFRNHTWMTKCICVPLHCVAHTQTHRHCDHELFLIDDLPNRYPTVFWPVQTHKLQHFAQYHRLSAEIKELGHFAHLKLDFAVVGADGCGTHSLHVNLMAHTDIDILDDNAFFRNYVRPSHLLPDNSMVQDFNAKVKASRGAFRRPLQGFVGVVDQGLSNSMLALERLGQVPGVRVIMLICEPLGRFEKNTWYDVCAKNLTRDCTFDITRSEHLVEQARHSLGPRLNMMRDLFKDRLKVVHQEALKSDPHTFYNGLASFIGASPIGAEMPFGRYNSFPGRRSNLCDDALRVQRFADLFESDNAMVEEFLLNSGEPVPASLHLRRTRCQSPGVMNKSIMPCIHMGRIHNWASMPSCDE